MNLVSLVTQSKSRLILHSYNKSDRTFSGVRDPFFRHYKLGFVGLCLFFSSVVVYALIEAWQLTFGELVVVFLFFSILMGLGATLVAFTMNAFSWQLRPSIAWVASVVTWFTPILAWGPVFGQALLVYGYFHFRVEGINMTDTLAVYFGHYLCFWAWIGWGVMTLGWGLVFLLMRRTLQNHFWPLLTGICFIVQGVIQLIFLGISGWFNPVLILLGIACGSGLFVIRQMAFSQE